MSFKIITGKPVGSLSGIVFSDLNTIKIDECFQNVKVLVTSPSGGNSNCGSLMLSLQTKI
jgi:hypothetical protein